MKFRMLKKLVSLQVLKTELNQTEDTSCPCLVCVCVCVCKRQREINFPAAKYGATSGHCSLKTHEALLRNSLREHWSRFPCSGIVHFCSILTYLIPLISFVCVCVCVRACVPACVWLSVYVWIFCFSGALTHSPAAHHVLCKRLRAF